MNMGTTGTYITLDIQIVNANQYNLTISTEGDVEIYEVSFYRISFDKTQLTASYENYYAFGFYEGTNSIEDTNRTY